MVLVTFDQRPCQQVVARFLDWPEVQRVYSLAGDVDALVHIRVERPDELSALIDQLSAVDGVSSAVSSVVLDVTRPT
jgi:DNA-binding Lrp family transcriptional regulator